MKRRAGREERGGEGERRGEGERGEVSKTGKEELSQQSGRRVGQPAR